MDAKTEKNSPDKDFTLRARMIETLSLQSGVTNTQIIDFVAALAQPASTVPQAEFDSVSSANGRLRAALSTLAQVNRAQASMLEDVFVERGIAK